MKHGVERISCTRIKVYDVVQMFSKNSVLNGKLGLINEPTFSSFKMLI